MNTELIKRLRALEAEIAKDVITDITYSNGKKVRVKLLDVIAMFIEGGAPDIVDIEFIGDISGEGILPELARYLQAELTDKSE